MFTSYGEGSEQFLTSLRVVFFCFLFFFFRGFKCFFFFATMSTEAFTKTFFILLSDVCMLCQNLILWLIQCGIVIAKHSARPQTSMPSESWRSCNVSYLKAAVLSIADQDSLVLAPAFSLRQYMAFNLQCHCSILEFRPSKRQVCSNVRSESNSQILFKQIG